MRLISLSVHEIKHVKKVKMKVSDLHFSCNEMKIGCKM